MNSLLSRLPFLNSGDDLEEVSEEDLKKDRIKFHRESVRNGPVKFSGPSSGQIRRAQARATRSRIKKNTRRQRHDHFAAKAESANLLGHLQAVGVVKYAHGHLTTRGNMVSSGMALLSRFPSSEEGGDDLSQSFQAALNRWQHLNGMAPTTLIGNPL